MHSIMHASAGSSDQLRAVAGGAIVTASILAALSDHKLETRPTINENSIVIENPCFLACAHAALHISPDALSVLSFDAS
jgi:hypothetical protein